MLIALIIGYMVILACLLGGIIAYVDSWRGRPVTEPEHPDLDYWHIAKLEREIWGQTFHNKFNGLACKCDQCTERTQMYGSDHYTYRATDLRRPTFVIHEQWEDREGE
jgi:hypothetical protein